MSVQDLRITEVMTNPSAGAYEYIEVTNTGTSTVNAGDFFVGNSDFSPEFYAGFALGPSAPDIPPGASVILVPSDVPVSQADFEAVYGPLPAGAVFISYLPFFFGEGPDFLPDGQTYTIGAPEIFADSVYIPTGAAPGQATHVTQTGPFSRDVTFGQPTPGTTGSAPPPPPSVTTITGTDGKDNLVGTSGDDVIDAGKGNDTVSAGSGDDSVLGGKGKDTILAGGGNDTVDGGSQSDTINGQGGDDTLFGGNGDDEIVGGSGSDLIYGGANNDVLKGGGDDDVIYGDHGADNLSGGSGNDTLYGGVSDDVLNGNDGNDSLYGDSGNDTLRGGDGDDSLFGGTQGDRLFGGSGNDLIDGGLGSDVLFGGTGADVFQFLETTNDDIIMDFAVGEDTIALGADLGITDLAAFLANNVMDVNGNAVVDLGGWGSVTLVGVATADLTIDDFQIEPPLIISL